MRPVQLQTAQSSQEGSRAPKRGPLRRLPSRISVSVDVGGYADSHGLNDIRSLAGLLRSRIEGPILAPARIIGGRSPGAETVRRGGFGGRSPFRIHLNPKWVQGLNPRKWPQISDCRGYPTLAVRCKLLGTLAPTPDLPIRTHSFPTRLVRRGLWCRSLSRKGLVWSP